MTPNQSKSFSSTDRTERRGLHAAIMNLPSDPVKASFDYQNIRMAYLMGHRDARHAAAELALESDAINAELLEALHSLLEAHPYANDGRDGYSVLVTAAQVDACRFARAAIKKATA